jgi:hypothetical protein
MVDKHRRLRLPLCLLSLLQRLLKLLHFLCACLSAVLQLSLLQLLLSLLQLLMCLLHLLRIGAALSLDQRLLRLLRLLDRLLNFQLVLLLALALHHVWIKPSCLEFVENASTGLRL